MDFLDDMEGYFDSINSEKGVICPSSNNESQNKNLEVFYKKLNDLGISLDELGDILECKENLLVVSSAGAGKSTGIILKLLRDILAGDLMKLVSIDGAIQTDVLVPCDVLVCTFLKTGAEDLKNTLNSWIKKLGITGIDTSKIHFKTIHAEVYDSLKGMGVPVSILEDPQSVVRAVVQKYGVKNVNSYSKGITVDEVNDVASLLAYARNRLDDKRYEHPLMEDYDLNNVMLDGLLNDTKLMRAGLGKLDFEDMQEMLLDALKRNPHVVDFISKRYDYIYVDEFQDTSQLQYELLKYYFDSAKRVIAVGDDDQTIYSWRGSDIEIITRKFEEDYNPKVLKLSTNYRCKSNILNSVIPSITKNTNRHQKDLKAFNEGGELLVICDSDVNTLKRGVLRDLGEGMSVGVLARTNADLLIPAILLELDGGVNFTLSKGVHLNSRMAKMTLGVIDLVVRRYSSNFEMYLKQIAPKYAQYEATKLCNMLSSNKKHNIYNIPEKDIEYSCPNLKGFILGLRKAKEQDGMLAYLYILEYLIKNVYTGDSQYSVKFREFTTFIKDLCMNHDSVKNMSIEDLDTLFSATLPENLSKRIHYQGEAKVKLTTVHESKGKEWDSVYIWGDNRFSFPNKLGVRDLTPEEYEEERRVHYIAWTRAKERLTVFTSRKDAGDFLLECDMSYVMNKKKKEEPKATEPTVVEEVKEKEGYTVVDTDSYIKGYITDVLNKREDVNLVKNCELLLNIYNLEGLISEVKKEEKTIDSVIADGEFELRIPQIFQNIIDKVWL